MKHLLLILLSISMFSVSCAQDVEKGSDMESLEISILDPEADGTVSTKYRVKGTVSDPEVEVWVIVLAEEVGEYWVQGRATVKSDGSWSIICHFGEAGTPSGTPFVIQAVVNPEEDIDTGDKLDYWPEAEGASDPVSVQR
ncbi:hypothetical protein KQI65_00485 [bacterium]|nr:hypothetical protein [bacterium]